LHLTAAASAGLKTPNPERMMMFECGGFPNFVRYSESSTQVELTCNAGQGNEKSTDTRTDTGTKMALEKVF
jgi:hypothetical protein